MYRKLFLMMAIMFFLAVIISGCGSDEKESEEDTEKTASQEETEDADDEDDEEEKDNEEKADKENDDSSDSKFDDLISYMEDETEGTADVLYESDDSQDHDMDDVSVSLDTYTLVELNDFHTNFDIPFDDQTDGGVIIAKYTVKNDTDDDVSYMPALPMTYEGAEKNLDNYRELLPEDKQLPELLSPDDDYKLESGDEVTGYYTYPMGEDRLDDVLDKGSADVEVSQPQKDADDFSSTFGDKGRFTLSLDEDQAEEEDKKDSEDFYEDKVTSDNMGDKEMLDSEKDIDDSKKLGDADVTFSGYQFTEFEPNSDEAPRFEDFDNGIVLLTVKFDIDNDGDAAIGKGNVDSKLTMDDGSKYTLGEGMLLDYKNDDNIERGDSGELLQVYTLDKEDYDKILQDKPFEVEVGPLRDTDSEDISKGKKVDFTFNE